MFVVTKADAEIDFRQHVSELVLDFLKHLIGPISEEDSIDQDYDNEKDKLSFIREWDWAISIVWIWIDPRSRFVGDEEKSTVHSYHWGY